MSVFQVTLNNIAQGYMDLNPSTATAISGGITADLGTEMSPSIQRTIYVTGPNLTYRKLVDGATFTDCNYWKRFCYPQVPLSQAFLTCTTDDGSVFSDVADENTYPVVQTLTVAGGSAFAANVFDILGTYGSSASFVQIANQGQTSIGNVAGVQDVRVRLNGSASAIFDLAAGETQVFNIGDLNITKLEFANTVSGGTTTTIQVIASLQSICAS